MVPKSAQRQNFHLCLSVCHETINFRKASPNHANFCGVCENKIQLKFGSEGDGPDGFREKIFEYFLDFS